VVSIIQIDKYYIISPIYLIKYGIVYMMGDSVSDGLTYILAGHQICYPSGIMNEYLTQRANKLQNKKIYLGFNHPN